MVKYIENILDEIPEYMKGRLEKPAMYHLFDIVEDPTKISRTNADIFHHFVAQLLYLSNKSRPDIHLAVLFLYTRLRYPDTDG